jgi:hypothetical protein
MLSAELFDVITPLVPWMDEGICDVSIHKELARLKYPKLDSIISFLMDQTPLLPIFSHIDFCTWAILTDLSSGPFQAVSSFTRNLNEFPIVIQKSNDSNIIFLEMISQTSLNYWLSLNSKSRYLAIPVSLDPEYKEKYSAGHACTLIFDNVQSQVYFFDPNGVTTFFGWENEILVDELFYQYFETFGSYKYVGRNVYNPAKLCLNRQFAGSSIENSGNCMITSILFAHYLCVTQLDIAQGIEIIGSLTDSDLLTVINGYSVGICRMGMFIPLE